MNTDQLKSISASVLVSLLVMVGSASAQDLTGSYGSFSESALRSAALESFGQSEQLEGSALDYFKFGVDIRAEYNDNVFLTNTGEEEDFIFRVSVPLELSNDETAAHKWFVRYTPKFNFYAENSDQDGVDQLLNAGYSFRFAKTSVDFGIGYKNAEGPNRFASGSIEKDGFDNSLAVSHVLSGKSRFDLDLGARTDDFTDKALFDRSRYNTRFSWQYQLAGKTTLGPYVAYEHVDVDTNPNHNAISGGIKATYKALQKTVVTGYCGVENREFDGGSQSAKTSPSFELGANHQYSGKISCTGLLYHNIRASYSDAGKSYSATGLNFFTRYAYSQRISFRTGVSYEHDNYFETGASTAGDLDSDYVTLYLGGSYVMDNGVTLGSGLRYSVNDSETNHRDFDNMVFNIDATYSF